MSVALGLALAWALGATIASTALWMDRELFRKELHRVSAKLARLQRERGDEG